MDRFVVISSRDAKEQQLPGFEGFHCNGGDYHYCLYETDGEKPLRLVGEDGFEPEDQSLVRDLEWVVVEMNRLAEERAQLRRLCSEMYQVAGVHCASDKVMDNLSAAANGWELPHKTLLPYTIEE